MLGDTDDHEFSESGPWGAEGQTRSCCGGQTSNTSYGKGKMSCGRLTQAKRHHRALHVAAAGGSGPASQ